MEDKIKYYSIILIAICTVIFIMQSFLSGFTDAFVLDSQMLNERPWTLITSVFLHGSLSHLAFNMFALFLFGLLLEKFIGSKKFLAVFFVSGLAASVAASFFYSSSLGASGAIYGVIGALAAIKPKMTVWTYGVPMPMVAAALFYLLLDFAGLFYPTNVANAAHIGGLLCGVIIGLALRKPEPRQEKREKILTDVEFREWEDHWM